MDFLNSGVAELFLDLLHKGGPAWISISWGCVLVLIVGPVLFLVMGPPVLGAFFEVGGGKHDHHGLDATKIVLEHLKVGETVSKESVNVVVFPPEWGGGLHEEGLDSYKGRQQVFVP